MKRVVRWLAIILSVLLLGGTATVCASAVFLGQYADVEMDMSLLSTYYDGEPAALYVYDPSDRAERRGEVHLMSSGVLQSARRQIRVSITEVPKDLVDAFVAIEDKRFYEHHGVDILRTLKAGVNYLTGGARSFGASTITQQLVKNLTERDEYTLDRKFTEIFSALDLERQADKSEIMEAYLNIINLANGCRGVGAAADFYFGKSVSELTLAECACIAAITNNPARYDPLTHPAHNRERRSLILSEMLAQGYITLDEYNEAGNTELTFLAVNEKKGRDAINSWYADMVVADVIRDLCDRLGYSRHRATMTVYSGGISIYTAMDEEMQAVLERYYANTENFPEGERGRPQSAMMLMDPQTGDILAVAGAVGEKTGNRLQNYATDTQRPAGSAIKPLSVYAPALEKGLLNWATVFEDEPLREEKGMPWPRNADGLYRGRITVDEAVAHSVNTVSVRVLEALGADDSFSFLRDRLHMTGLTSADKTISSLALGQQSGGVSVRELTAGYTIFCKGVYRAPVSYHKVVDADGRVLLENPPVGEIVLSEANAAVMTHLLEGVVTEGTAAGKLTLSDTLDISVAGKTGTTQYNCDRWFVGYTPRLLAGVWMGYDYPTELRGIDGNPCLRIWDEVITACERTYHGAAFQSDFDRHPDVIRVTFCRDSGRLPTSDCTHLPSRQPVRDGWFVRGTEPRDGCEGHE